MIYLLLLPMMLQAVAILFDEFYFHWKRGLPKWERIGHPIDTLSVVLCLLYVVVLPYSYAKLFPFIALGLFSSFLVTKDEFVHKDLCPKMEQWLHALLFVLHPMMLISLALIWRAIGLDLVSDEAKKWLTLFLKMELGFIITFMSYQCLYWNFIWQEKR